LRRAQRLSDQRREEIARLGAEARKESLRLAKAIQNNFDYVVAILQLYPTRLAVSQHAPNGRLPGIYEKER